MAEPSSVLVIGSGGREHALALALERDPQVPTVHAAPGNPGTAAGGHQPPRRRAGRRGRRRAGDPARASTWSSSGRRRRWSPGSPTPSAPPGSPASGRPRRAARLEGSKAFAKEVMAAAGVPTAAAARLRHRRRGRRRRSTSSAPPYVVKDDGLAAGKGVVVTSDRDEALDHAAALRPGRDRGVPRRTGGQPVRRHRRRGPSVPLQPAQDFKRVGDGDTGPEHRRDGRLHAAAVGARRPGRRGDPDRPAADRRRARRAAAPPSPGCSTPASR